MFSSPDSLAFGLQLIAPICAVIALYLVIKNLRTQPVTDQPTAPEQKGFRGFVRGFTVRRYLIVFFGAQAFAVATYTILVDSNYPVLTLVMGLITSIFIVIALAKHLFHSSDYSLPNAGQTAWIVFAATLIGAFAVLTHADHGWSMRANAIECAHKEIQVTVWRLGSDPAVYWPKTRQAWLESATGLLGPEWMKTAILPKDKKFGQFGCSDPRAPAGGKFCWLIHTPCRDTGMRREGLPEYRPFAKRWLGLE